MILFRITTDQSEWLLKGLVVRGGGVKWKSEKREVSSGWGFALVLWLLLFCVTLQCKGFTRWQVEQRGSGDRNYLDVGKMDVGKMDFFIYMQKCICTSSSTLLQS